MVVHPLVPSSWIPVVSWPVICFLTSSLLLGGHTSLPGIACNLLLSLLVTVILAFLYARYVEQIGDKLVNWMVDHLVRSS